MAICPICHAEGELCQECPSCHKHFVEEVELKKSGDDELLGDIVGGQYVPLALIGEGGMGKIYRAKAKYTGKIVALKMLKSEYMEDETLKDRFFREAEVVSALEHPNIVKMYGCAPDPDHNTIFMAMELLKGKSLFDVLRKDVPDLLTMLKFYHEIAAALGEAHKHGIFHRDLKPENVFIIVNDDGQSHAKVLDFGFARLQNASKKLTMAGVAFGTPHYMSPEQAMGLDNITAACDIYALGIMLFEAVSGKLPFNNESPMEVMRAQCFEPAPACVPRNGYDVPKKLFECIEKCMNKDPNARYADGQAVAAELQQIIDDCEKGSAEMANKVVSQKVMPAVTATKNSVKKMPKMMVILGCVLILLVIIAIILVIAL